MNHTDHVALIREGIPVAGGVWADFGSGSGAFTLALADCLGPNGQIYSIDKSNRALRTQKSVMNGRFPQTAVTYLQANYTRPLHLPPLDGILIANALHFQRRKDGIVQQFYSYLRPGGRFVVVEYNVDRGNMWVPHPFSFSSWQTIASRNGFVHTTLLNRRPSRFLSEIYSAISFKEK
ncbi:class I SAM-dependent methyltransferase [Candidatus Leptofilum sp.]|uniref:class I SAM-dependent methyltransferase n=1 Tax=Candidatus Leptofilum sp. TaxID=3241576 RepID=UPI003B5BBAFD